MSRCVDCGLLDTRLALQGKVRCPGCERVDAARERVIASAKAWREEKDHFTLEELEDVEIRLADAVNALLCAEDR
jgi:uncharacterized Zn finger protein (UPF0148 family)